MTDHTSTGERPGDQRLEVSTQGARPAPDMVWVDGGHSLHGQVRTPGDKSISHRALIIGAMAEGTSVVRGLSDGADVRHTVSAVQALGADVHDDGATVVVTGGRHRLHAPEGPIDCGNSGTGMRLLSGLVAGLLGETVLVGDGSLSTRPMDRVAEPLRAMGAAVDGDGDRCRPPLRVVGAALNGITYTPPVASAQVKSAILLAGVWATGATVVHEPVRTRAHTEELLAAAGADLEVRQVGQGRTVTIRPSSLIPFTLTIPGDPSQAAFWIVAGCLVPDSHVTVLDVYLGPDRIGFLDVLVRMGADIDVHPGGLDAVRAPGDAASSGAPSGAITARPAPLHATEVQASEIASLDEVPILAVAAAAAHGVTRFRDVGELRVKESDRLAAVARLVEAIGARADVVGDDLVVHGAGGLSHARTDSGGDHRMAMAAAIAALAAGQGESRIDGFASVATSYPTFLDDLRRLGASARLRRIAIDGPAGSGKSTVSRALSARLGIERLDTGAMYRAVAWAALDRGIDLQDPSAVIDLAGQADIAVGPRSVCIDGTDVTDAIRSPAVNRGVSVVAANPGVRELMVARQRRWIQERGGGVMEGRDIGTVVLPDADLKVYLTASADERARRRDDETADGVARRDRLDASRQASPMVKAHDARLLDTTGRTVASVVDEILSWL